MTSTAAILRDLARVRAAFQLRAIEAVITERDTRCADLLPGNAGNPDQQQAEDPRADRGIYDRGTMGPEWIAAQIAKGAAK